IPYTYSDVNLKEASVQVKYADRDFYIDRVVYDFKGGDYNIFVLSPSSPDSSFSISASFDGKIRWDSYEDRVLSMSNTAERINREYRQALDNVFESTTFPYETFIAYGDIEFVNDENVDQPFISDYAILMSGLELDGYYDIGELGRKAGRVIVHIYDKDVSIKRLSEVLLGIKAALNKSGVEFKAIDCVIEPPKPEEGYADGYNTDSRVEVMQFFSDDIYEEGLEERVAQADKAAKAYNDYQDGIKQQEIDAYEQALNEQKSE
ncbi:MAG: hypothetical protein IIX36_06505, partial [Clostridia bacterium]|nr:hypothetical protein [Clostridia bacterium]